MDAPPAAGYWAQARAELADRDPVLARLLADVPPPPPQRQADPFQALARAIIGQQISVRAADAVWSRLRAAVDPLDPAAVAGLEQEPLRACGLSARKAAYLQDLARHCVDGRIDWSTLVHSDDESVVQTLTGVKGIGRWTAEMFLIFNLQRPDVWPVDDLGLKQAVQVQYGCPERPGRRELTALGETLRPWRSVATWTLWRSLKPAGS